MCARGAASSQSKALLLSSRTWGEFGNYLSAKRLEKQLTSSGNFSEIVHECFEDYCPYFSEIGEKICQLSTGSKGAGQRQEAYKYLISEVEAHLPAGFESAFDPLPDIDLDKIRAKILSHSPDMVIGTKGLISRLVARSVASDRLRPLIVNYVTNDGLLTLPIHRSSAPDLQLVQTNLGRSALLRTFNTIDANSIQVVGPLVSPPKPDAIPPLTVGLLLNRGGQEYWPLLHRLAEAKSAADVRIVCIGNPELLHRLRAFASKAAPLWQIEGKLAPSEYLSRLDQLARYERRVFICKSAPSTVFEALTRKIPVLAMNSGLPMEEWVGRLVIQHEVGGFFERIDDLIVELDEIMASDCDKLAQYRRRISQFVSAVLFDFQVGEKINAAFRQILDARKQGVVVK